MLKPAQLYRDQIDAAYLETWYDLNYMYFTMGTGTRDIHFDEDNFDRHAFVSIDSKGDLVGLIMYSVDYTSMSATNMGIIVFQFNNVVFINDLKQVIRDIFLKYNLNRLSFYSIADNPVSPKYEKLVKKFGGTVCGYQHECIKLIDGSLHDVIYFEIMAKDFKSKYKLVGENRSSKL